MKYLNLLLLLFGCLLSSNISAQTPKQIEDDLLKLFKKIDYWSQKRNDTSFDIIKVEDSLEKANDAFARKFERYTEKFPSTLTQQFQSLRDSGLGIVSSEDSRLRIYFWDTNMGGTQVDDRTIVQYKKGLKTNSIEVEGSFAYNKICTLKKDATTYYLATYTAKMSSQQYLRGVQIFSIEKGILNDNVKLIKTSTGLHSSLEFSYLEDYQGNDGTEILYDGKSAILEIPVVLENGKANGNYITYKFTGQYFERVKN
jgi:hypothetical protein